VCLFFPSRFRGSIHNHRHRPQNTTHFHHKDSRIEEGRGIACTTRFPSPPIKPDVRISRIRLSGWLHRKQTAGGSMSVVHTPTSPWRCDKACADGSWFHAVLDRLSPIHQPLPPLTNTPEVRVLASTGVPAETGNDNWATRDNRGTVWFTAGRTSFRYPLSTASARSAGRGCTWPPAACPPFSGATHSFRPDRVFAPPGCCRGMPSAR
jgi:hypothetical protein